MAKLSDHGIRLSSMSPSFLHSNSTSHIWPFSAVAELVDNALDPGVSAKQIWIDVVEEAGHLCLTFVDNGSGMTPNKLHKMLSFGFTDKGSGKASQQAIGLYGNGFKSGSMRLGRDALIFTKNGGCQTVGMLSQTFLENIKAQAVIVPIVPFNQQTKSLLVTEDSEASLAAILKHSIVSSQEQIHTHFDSILSKKGTKILIWNICRDKDGRLEIDFDTDVSDFRLPEIHIEELKKGLRGSGSLRAEQNIPDTHYSLRAYLSVLYLKPRIQIIVRGKKIIAKLVSKSLTHIEHDVYKPNFSKEKVKVTFGLNPKNKYHYGILMYHKNRLIKAYEKVGCQLKASGQRAGVGVIGIIECDFLRPAHNKQDFVYTKEYRLTLGALGLKLNDYWQEVTKKRAREREFQALDSREENKDEPAADDGPVWLQCEECLKWRSVPAKHYDVAPESWDCSRNPNPRYRRCSAPEEAEESGELLTPSYQKNQKKQEHAKRRKRERSLEVCESQDQQAKHQILSRSSSEPFHPTYQSAHTPDRCHKEENTLERDQTQTDHHTDTHTNDEAQTQNRMTAGVPHTQQKPDARETVIEDQMQIGQVSVDKEANSQSGESGETDEKKDTHMEREESTDTLSPGREQTDLKSTSGFLFNCERKKTDIENMADEMTPQIQTLSLEKTEQDGSSGVLEKPGDAAQQTPTILTWTPSLPPAQTVLVSPQSPAEGPQGRLPLNVMNWEAEVQKLAGLEEAAQGLRRLLGLKTSQGPMTTADCGAEKPKEVAAARREVGCQTDMAESQRAERGQREQPEQNRPRMEKTDTQSRTRVSDSEAYEGSRSAQEDLRGLRNNLVVLLTALLPQLDLTDISLETPDVDNILQQILEVNSLKL